MPRVNIPAEFESLSEDARALAGGHFGVMMRPGRGELRFRTPGRITARAKDALVELTEAGVCSYEVEPSGAWVYRPLVDCTCFFQWLGRNKHAGRFNTVSVDGRP